tara:strand:- start:909 stop:1874 length:966 start_codon:yes stop_codon:yes gene_type:complete
MQFKLKKIKSDASFREFFRLYKGKKTSIIITAKKERFKNLIVYTSINKFLIKRGIFTPKLISSHFKEGIIEIEDLGKDKLLDHIRVSKNKFFYYKKCVDLILKLQKITPPKKIKIESKKYLNFSKYNISELHKESDLFFDWYLYGVLGKKKSKKFKLKIKRELNKIYKKIIFKNNFLVHRDFHVSNIMYINKKLGLIDTQDAILGNPAYDLASLIDDVRLKVPNKIKLDTFNYYVKKSNNKNYKTISLKNDFDILSVQRNLKILGIFFRLYLRDNKKEYLKYLPYVWTLLEKRMKNNIFNNLEKILSKAISKKLRKKRFFK